MDSGEGDIREHELSLAHFSGPGSRRVCTQGDCWSLQMHQERLRKVCLDKGSLTLFSAFLL